MLDSGAAKIGKGGASLWLGMVLSAFVYSRLIARRSKVDYSQWNESVGSVDGRAVATSTSTALSRHLRFLTHPPLSVVF